MRKHVLAYHSINSWENLPVSQHDFLVSTRMQQTRCYMDSPEGLKRPLGLPSPSLAALRPWHPEAPASLLGEEGSPGERSPVPSHTINPGPRGRLSGLCSPAQPPEGCGHRSDLRQGQQKIYPAETCSQNHGQIQSLLFKPLHSGMVGYIANVM